MAIAVLLFAHTTPKFGLFIRTRAPGTLGLFLIRSNSTLPGYESAPDRAPSMTHRGRASCLVSGANCSTMRTRFERKN